MGQIGHAIGCFMRVYSFMKPIDGCGWLLKGTLTAVNNRAYAKSIAAVLRKKHSTATFIRPPLLIKQMYTHINKLFDDLIVAKPVFSKTGTHTLQFCPPAACGLGVVANCTHQLQSTTLIKHLKMGRGGEAAPQTLIRRNSWSFSSLNDFASDLKTLKTLWTSQLLTKKSSDHAARLEAFYASQSQTCECVQDHFCFWGSLCLLTVFKPSRNRSRVKQCIKFYVISLSKELGGCSGGCRLLALHTHLRCARIPDKRTGFFASGRARSLTSHTHSPPLSPPKTPPTKNR
jgi:hypothetical protein